MATSPFIDLKNENLKARSLQELLVKAIKEATGEKIATEDVHVEHPQEESHGDFASNIAMMLAKKLQKNPREIAEKIVNALEKSKEEEGIESLEIAGPGFINFKLKNQWLIGQMLNIVKEGEKYGSTAIGKGKKEMVEFNQANTNKHFHVGHLRNTSLGESISRILEFNGFKVWRTSYQGDLGLHVAKTIWTIENTEGAKEKSKKLEGQEFVDFLSDIYVEGDKQYKNNEKAKKEIDLFNKELVEARQKESGELYEYWLLLKNKSLKYFDSIYKLLDTYFDKLYFDSDVVAGKEDVLKGLKKGIFEEDQGSVIFRGEKYGLHTRVFINKLGVPTYDAKDIRLAQIKKKNFDFGHCVFVLGREQMGYFEVLFKVLELLGLIKEGEYYNRHYGFVNLSHKGKTVKMSSRLGNVVTLIDLVDEAKEKIKQHIDKSDKKYSAKEKEEIIEAAAIGALKYSMLKIEPEKAMSFNMEQSISFDGDSAPYLQYTYARANSVLSKTKGKAKTKLNYTFEAAEEQNLLRILYKYPEIVNDAMRFLEPHRICPYLFELAQEFNKFYNKLSILNADTKEEKEARISLTASTAIIIKSGLNLLGIRAPERM